MTMNKHNISINFTAASQPSSGMKLSCWQSHTYLWPQMMFSFLWFTIHGYIHGYLHHLGMVDGHLFHTFTALMITIK
jgi:hypothetical protein